MRKIHCLIIIASLLIYALLSVLINFPYSLTTQTFPESKSTIQNLIGKRIAISIRTTNRYLNLNLQKTIDSLRDTCESGAIILLTIYSTHPYPVEVINILNSKIKCRNAIGKINADIKLINLSVEETERYNYNYFFMKHLDDFDLFVYAEDHLYLRMIHIFSYFVEIERLENILPKRQFADYTLGFFRYGLDEINRQQVSCNSIDSIPDRVLKRKYIAVEPSNQIYMLTSDQLRLRINRCQDPSDRCDLNYIIPSDYFEDFAILDTTYRLHNTTRSRKNQCQTSYQLQNTRLSFFETDTIQRRFVTREGIYNGITIVVNDTEQNLNDGNVRNKAYVSGLNKLMRQYEEYSSNGGKFYFYKGTND